MNEARLAFLANARLLGASDGEASEVEAIILGGDDEKARSLQEEWWAEYDRDRTAGRRCSYYASITWALVPAADWDAYDMEVSMRGLPDLSAEFRRRPGVPASPTAKAIARSCIEERSGGVIDPFLLSVLADRLEDDGIAGDIVTHLRGPGPHYLGCWAVEAVR